MISETAKEIFKEAELSRLHLEKKNALFLGSLHNIPSGEYLRNFGACALNRQIDIYDDAILLLKADRVQAACTISRAMIETYAFSKYVYSKVHKQIAGGINQEVVAAALETILKFTNSSRYKVNEQERVSKKVFSLDDYEFTAQARERMELGLAASEHVMNALRELYKDEKAHTGLTESRFEHTYDILSEWVHPSQTSIFHHYVKETQMIPCSIGFVNLFDSAKLQCAMALHFLTDAKSQYEFALKLADIMDSVKEC